MKNRKAIFVLFLALCLPTKLYFIKKENPNLRFNDDDQRNFTIAKNYVSGMGYGIYDPMAHRYRLSAFHTSSTIFLYQFLINKKVSQKSIVIGFYILSTILYLLAIHYVYRILNLLEISQALTYSATALFAFYPSVIYAIGGKYYFDNLVMPLHIINYFFLLKWIRTRSLTFPANLFLIISITFCCFFRSQILLLYFITGCFLLTQYIKDHIKTKCSGNAMLYFLIGLALSLIIAYTPVLIKNKKMFGADIISTQAGFELFTGHNSINGGNWRISHPGDSLDRYLHKKIPTLETLDEYSESKARRQLAIDWIRKNPSMEIKYIFKKMARYFMPENGATTKPVFKYHPITFLIHLIFLTGIVAFLLKDKRFLLSKDMLLLLIPVVATLLLSVIFFFDFKLRYHAEPFVIIMAIYMADRFIKSRNKTGNTKNDLHKSNERKRRLIIDACTGETHTPSRRQL